MIEKILLETFCQKKLTLATAESCTGGMLAERITDVSGSSQIFAGGVVTYSNAAKSRVLGVPEDIINRKGAVSEDVAVAMARRVREIHNSHYGIGITGIAGPTGGSKHKPIGTVFVAFNTELETFCLHFEFKGTREQIRRQATEYTLEALLEFLV
ncbi:MAG: CinA family protein [Candidatus Omnitrophota bacterium]